MNNCIITNYTVTNEKYEKAIKNAEQFYTSTFSKHYEDLKKCYETVRYKTITHRLTVREHSVKYDNYILEKYLNKWSEIDLLSARVLSDLNDCIIPTEIPEGFNIGEFDPKRWLELKKDLMLDTRIPENKRKEYDKQITYYKNICDNLSAKYVNLVNQVLEYIENTSDKSREELIENLYARQLEYYK